MFFVYLGVGIRNGRSSSPTTGSVIAPVPADHSQRFSPIVFGTEHVEFQRRRDSSRQQQKVIAIELLQSRYSGQFDGLFVRFAIKQLVTSAPIVLVTLRRPISSHSVDIVVIRSRNQRLAPSGSASSFPAGN